MAIQDHFERPPELVVDSWATEEQRQALADFVHVIDNLPLADSVTEILVPGIELHDENPALVRKVAAYISEQPLGQAIISAWAEVYDTQAEEAAGFDDDTEAQLSNDADHKTVVKQLAEAAPDAKEKPRAALRRSRLTFFANRRRAA